MKVESFDIAIIGCGPAGLAAAISAKQNGAKKVLVIDRNSWSGGILNQCIHDGFGVEETGISMTGPEYAEKYVHKAEQLGVLFMLETMVLDLNFKKEIIAVNRIGLYKIKANSIILSMGCREKTRWNVMIPGTRPSGIFTAGVAQAFINLYNIIPGKNILILGSGDVGLIMARRLKFEGANVLGVVEILPYASGLLRNVVQCLKDYDIPLYLNHTITSIEGKDRLEKVVISQVDNERFPIVGSEKDIFCDTLLLSLGLIPENELSKNLGVKIDPNTGGPVVNQCLETTISGVFACGNCLQVYDTVDMLSVDSQIAGYNASSKIFKKNNFDSFACIIPGGGVGYVVPQVVDNPGKIWLTFRVKKPNENIFLDIKCGNIKILRKKFRWVNPANMIRLEVDISSEIINSGFDIEVSIDE